MERIRNMLWAPNSNEVQQMIDQMEPDAAIGMSFGRWLLIQRDRGDWIDGIADRRPSPTPICWGHAEEAWSAR